jgi:hypothetical protein
MRNDGYALLLVLALVLTVGLAAGLMAVRTAQEADQARAEGEQALAVMNLNNQQNQLTLLLSGSLREELRRALGIHSRPGRFAFGDGTDTPTQASLIADMEPLRQDMQRRADNLLCGQGFRLYLTRTACDVELPANIQLGLPGFVSGAPRIPNRPATIQRFRLPFVAYVRGEHGEAMQERFIAGAYEFDLGAAMPSRYVLLLDNAYNTAGQLHLFGNETVFEGRTHVAGLLGVRQMPWFAGAVTTGSCPTLGVDGSCMDPATPGLVFATQGFVSQAAMLPRPDRPCLGPDCPVWGEGIDPGLANLSAGRMELAGWQHSLSVNHTVQRVGLWPEGGRQYLEVCDPDCHRFRVNGDWLERWVGPTPGGWWQPEIQLPRQDDAVRLRLRVNGAIQRLASSHSFGWAVADDVSVEIVAEQYIRITSSLALQNSPCTFIGGRSGDRLVPSRCDNTHVTGRLAVVSLQNNILLGRGHADPTLNLAEDNPSLHGHFMAPRGSIGAENLQAAGQRGTAFVLGALTMNRWTDWAYGGQGWNLILTYDPRLRYRPAIAEERYVLNGVLGVFLQITGEQRPG